jgi:DNA gyrase subunit A
MAEQIIKTEYSDVMQTSYINYAMSVITARALPDARDGLKPVQRRVLYAMDQLGLNYDKPHRKSARIVGDTMGKFHPHGDSSIYEALVVMEQDFKKGMALVDGHGNFGSIEGDGAAAMRYTEAKLKKFTQDVYLADLDKNVVDFLPNFDETEQEPEVLPVRVPNLLINGAEGIAVGMTTSIPTHNLTEVVDAMIAYMGNPKITTEELMTYLPGPDFPTGGLVVNQKDLLQIYETGTGKIKVRGKVEFEPGKRKSDRDKLVISEIPYTMIGANIGKFIADVCDLIETKKTQDIVDISNESSKEGIRIVLELRKNADVEKLENMLYKKTKLEDTFGVNMLAIADGRPEVLGLKDVLSHCVNFQYDLMTRKYTTLLNKALEQKEIKEGLIRACNIIDLIIEIIRGSQNLKQVKACLIHGDTTDIKFKNPESEIYAQQLSFTEKQAQAIVELRLYRLIGLEIMALEKEYSELVNQIAQYEDILNSRRSMTRVIKKDLEKIKKEYGVERRTQIVNAKEAVYEEEKMVEQEVAFVMDRFGYAKLLDAATFDKNRDTITAENKYSFICMNTEKICLFTDQGNMHLVKVSDLPVKRQKDKGIPIDNISNYDSGKENIVNLYSLWDIIGKHLLFTTSCGMMKLVNGSEFQVSKRTVAATKLGDGDTLVSVTIAGAAVESDPMAIYTADGDGDFPEGYALSGGEDAFDDGDGTQMIMDFAVEDVEPLPQLHDNQWVVLQTAGGMFLRFNLSEIPEKKKGAIGVRGIKLAADDKVTGVYILSPGDQITIRYKEKDVELRKIKSAKRDTRGTKIRA